jgi:prenylcysteine oxidase/farnesylcysteine lyase
MKSVAIIGSGISGSSAAYFTSQLIPNLKITIYEQQNRIGGRIFTHNTDDASIELGATFFNRNNKIILNLARNNKLRVTQIEGKMDFAVWNGEKTIFKSNKKIPINSLMLLKHYKLDFAKTAILIREMKNKIEKIYQEIQTSEKTIEEHFESEGITDWVKRDFEGILFEQGISRTFVNEMITPVTRAIYSQNGDIGGLAGIASLIGTYYGNLCSILDGNNNLPVQLIKAAHAITKLEQKVVCIEKTSRGLYKVITDLDETTFDGIIIATPLELAKIALEGMKKPTHETQYQEVYIKVMKGIVNPSYFGFGNSTDLPSTILTTEKTSEVTHFRMKKIKKEQSLVTITSTKPLSKTDLSELFKREESTVVEHHWKAAYPKFKPITRIPKSQIDERIIYPNAIETAISSLETSSWSALSAANILKKQFSESSNYRIS